MDECHTKDNGSVCHKDWPHKIYIGNSPIFHGPAILLNILKTVWWRNVILGIMDQSDTKVGLMKYCLMEECHTWNNGSIWHKGWPHEIYVGQWPIFHGTVTLLNILKTIWWRYVILGIMDQCDTKIDLIKYEGQSINNDNGWIKQNL